MIRVCDAIMGQGKTQSAINYINEHPELKFIYVTPYLKEADRIKNDCPKRHFITPSNKIKEYNFKKRDHIHQLILDGRNIATTHSAFKNCTPEMLEDIKKDDYVLIIDENISIIEMVPYNTTDLEMLISGGYIAENNGELFATDQKYDGILFKDIFSLLKSRDLMRMNDPEAQHGHLYFWTLPPSLLQSFKDVFILTYLFEGQGLHHFLNIYNFEYKKISVSLDDTGFHFCEPPGYIPEYVTHIKERIHVLDNTKMNSIGDEYYALSLNWFKRNEDGNVDKLQKNTYNYFNNIENDHPSEKRMWATFSNEESKMRGKGYTKAFLTFNARATNDYRDRDCLVYLTNIFMNASEKHLYESKGIKVNEDLYALSIMIQWIWRSAIRDGNDIYIYLPSRRMRDLLNEWMDKISRGEQYIA